jgi:hypothetical protein
MYVPGLRADELEETGFWGAGTVATAQARANDNISQLDAAGFPMVLLHSAPLGGGPTPVPTTVVSMIVETLAATQRRRVR